MKQHIGRITGMLGSDPLRGEVFYDEEFTRREVEFLGWAFAEQAGRKVEDVLDVGVGTGRSALPLAQQGYRLTGLDLSPEVLAVFREQAAVKGVSVTAVQGDMRAMEFDAAFDALYISTTFWMLITDDDILATLRGFHRALRPDGAAIVFLRNPFSNLFGFGQDETLHHERDGVRLFTSIKYRQVDNVRNVWRYDVFRWQDDHGRLSSDRWTFDTRHPTYLEMMHFFGQAGFETVRCFGSFRDHREVTRKASRLIFVAVK